METITYCLLLNNGEYREIVLRFNADSWDLMLDENSNNNSHTLLEFNRCPHCPLKKPEHNYCPAAMALHSVKNFCFDLISYDTVNVTVITKERAISAKTTVQRGISSLLGLILASSGCPYTAFFKPMARFHLPFASEMETSYRVLSMCALSPTFANGDADNPIKLADLLKSIYANLELVNVNLLKRFRPLCQGDATLNSVVLLDLFTKGIPFSCEQSIAALSPLFAAFNRR